MPFEGYRIWELPPNGQGLAVLEMLRLLEPYDLESMGHNSAAYLHHLIEAKKLAYADLEQFVGDPETMSIEVGQLLGDHFIAQRRSLIDPVLAQVRVEPDRSLTTSETTYLTVADKDGIMVSLISSLAGGFGSGVVVPHTGFALHNRGAAFSLEKGRGNTVGPRRLPFHTIIPAFVTRAGSDGQQEPWLSFGFVGGPQQPAAQVQMLLNLLLFDMDVQQALAVGRFRHVSGPVLALEDPIPATVIRELESRGHRIRSDAIRDRADADVLVFGAGQAVRVLERGYVAGSDPRLDGQAAGY